MKRLLFVVTALGTGGAEIMLEKLISRLDRGRCEPAVLSLGLEGTVGPRIAALEVPLFCAGLVRGSLSTRRIAAAVWAVRRFRPDVLQGWMYHGNLASSMLRRACARSPRLLWSVRQTVYDLANEKPRTARIIRAGAKLSSGVDRIVYNSALSARQHAALGYDPARSVVIPNGFDTDAFSPGAAARAAIRAELGCPADATLVGLVARYHPMKDHANLLDAASRMPARHAAARFVMAGRGVDEANGTLTDLIARHGLQGRVALLGERADVARLTAAFDVAVSASAWGEGFSNSIGEAMSAGVPCVVTDVGDSADIVGDTGRVVPARDPAALAGALSELLDLVPSERTRIGTAARQRVVDRYSIDRVVESYQALWEGD